MVRMFVNATLVVMTIISTTSLYGLGPGAASGNFLKIDVGARATAMGGAVSAIIDDPTALYWNPAGLVNLREANLYLSDRIGFAGVNQGYLGFAFPALDGFTAFGVNYVRIGDIDGRDNQGNPTGSFGASDLLASFGYAHELRSNLSVGFSAGFLSDRIEDSKENTFVGGIGVIAEASPDLFLGLSVRNLGGTLSGYPLPLSLTIGVGGTLQNVTLSADVEIPRDGVSRLRTGIEWPVLELLAIRGAFGSGRDIGSGVSTGLGFRMRPISIDYAYVPFGDLGSNHYISASIDLGGQ